MTRRKIDKEWQLRMISAMHGDGIRILEKADECFRKHRQQYGTWAHGDPKRCWIDEANIMCIMYEDGCWWHYEEGRQGLTWW